MVTALAFPKKGGERFGVKVVRAFTVCDVDVLASIRDLVEADKVLPHISTVLPLAEVKQALAVEGQEVVPIQT